MTKPIASDAQLFKKTLQRYKTLIDEDIAEYSKYARRVTLQQYGADARLETDAFLDVLSRGGKRIRGALVMLGYEMSGGTDLRMIVQAARALEMIHAHMLIVDDIQDRSRTRRGGPAAHVALADYHRQQRLAGDPEHFGMAVAINSGISGTYAAQNILAGLDADPQLCLNVLGIVGQTVITTAHGQTCDIMNEVVADVSAESIRNVLEWKSAQYTVLNPLCVGMVLAGADCAATDAIRDYALGTGMAFQVSDDILSTFGAEFESGKSPMDDIREGKRTLMVAYALEHVSTADQNYLLEVLGDARLTPAQFERARAIMDSCGALDYARAEMKRYIDTALQSLERESARWTDDGVRFLRHLATYMLTRRS
ncbi:polyprenyl synthetase [Candidatus Saccharibacteria bacterium]|nr:MAG: polyprenyl synthetase [Candidatus Saccharibacteria bacterium]